MTHNLIGEKGNLAAGISQFSCVVKAIRLDLNLKEKEYFQTPRWRWIPSHTSTLYWHAKYGPAPFEPWLVWRKDTTDADDMHVVFFKMSLIFVETPLTGTHRAI